MQVMKYNTMNVTWIVVVATVINVPSNFVQLRRPFVAVSRKFLHDLTTARRFKSFIVICCILQKRKFQLRGNNSVITILWFVTPYSLVGKSLRFFGTHILVPNYTALHVGT
jgi:hypothetical protein